jgi:hypothetical protein
VAEDVVGVAAGGDDLLDLCEWGVSAGHRRPRSR